jgi:dipeptidyl aminopeptidase/acylaminoacyl peptidase
MISMVAVALSVVADCDGSIQKIHANSATEATPTGASAHVHSEPHIQSKATEVGGLPSVEHVASLVATAPQIPEVALSPDGRYIAYTVARGSIVANLYQSKLLVQRVISGGARTPVISITSVESDARRTQFFPQWRPGTQSPVLSFIGTREALPQKVEARGLIEYDLDSAELRNLPSPTAEHSQGAPVNSCELPASVGEDYRWSPSGSAIAFTALLRDGATLDQRRGTVVSAQWRSASPRRSVFVMNAASGQIEQCSSPSVHVLAFDWAPDARRLVLAATEDSEGVPLMRTDLYVFDLATGTLSPLVVQPGLDGVPCWSPDGQWIVFSSHFGEPAYSVGGPAIVPGSGGRVIRVASPEGPNLPWDASIFWAGRKRWYFSSYQHMTSRLFRVDLASRRIEPVSVDETSYDTHFSASHDGRRVAFTRQTLLQPPEVFVQSLLPEGQAKQQTRLEADAPEHVLIRQSVRMDTLEWPSSDGKFTIHGLLLTPRSAWTEGRHARVKAPLPTAIYVYGGPAMIRRGFAADGGAAAMAPLAARGYAVFAVNTRGRGGYGERFRRGIRDSGSVGRLPYEDLLGGVKILGRRGIADLARLGIWGHSYGGYLAAYALTQTTSFRAAVILEGGPFERIGAGMQYAAPGTDWALLTQELSGVRDPYDPEVRAVLMDESPLLHANRIATPTLLMYGAGQLAENSGWPFYGALQRFKVPSRFVVYDDGHVFTRPAAVTDAIVRTINWMDQWVQDAP